MKQASAIDKANPLITKTFNIRRHRIAPRQSLVNSKPVNLTEVSVKMRFTVFVQFFVVLCSSVGILCSTIDGNELIEFYCSI